MADLFVQPGILTGSLTAPPSKSMAHRAVICAALAGNQDPAAGLCAGPELSDDILATARAMTALLSGEKELFCMESGSTLRFLIPIAAALGKDVVFTGSGRLPERPLGDYQRILGEHGVLLDFPPNASLPLRLHGKLAPGVFSVPGNVSSQYVTGLLLALPLLDKDSSVSVTSELESAPYVDMTIEVMRHFGVFVETCGSGWKIPGNQRYREASYCVEGDYSQAAFWLTANFLGSDISVEGLSADSVQGDRQILAILEMFSGAKHAADIGETKGEKPTFEIDASQIPDLIPAVAVAAANIRAVTRIVRAQRLRFKESDRLQTTVRLIRAIGGNAEETPDGLVIEGGSPLAGGTADSFGDHRIAMAAAVAALTTQSGVVIQNYRCVKKSYPSFFEEFKRIGGQCYELDMGKQS